MPKDQLRTAIDALRARLQEELETQLTALTERQEQAIDEARQRSEAAAELRWAAKLEAVRTDWAARLESEVATTRAAADRRLAAEVARLRDEAEQASAEAAEKARAEAQLAAAAAAEHARAEAEQAAARVRAEAEQAAAKLVARVRAEADQAAAQVAAKLRAEAEQAAANAAIRVREEAELEIDAERARGIELLDAERERSSADLDAERQRASALLDAERQRVEAERQAERQRADADRLSERQRFETERQQFRAERQRFEAERQQFAVERERFAAAAQDQEAAHSRTGLLDSDLRRVEAELASERAQLQQLSDALRGANESLRRVEAVLAQERQERAEQAAVAPPPPVPEADPAAIIDARAAERDSQLAIVERLLSAMRSMDEAGSLTQILTAVAEGAGAEAPRAALFIANGRHLQGMKAVGFSGVDIATERLPIDGDGLLALAMTRGEAVSSPEQPDAEPPAFAALDPGRAAIAVPIVIGGEPVAVLYADDGAGDESIAPASWPEAVQILGSHAASCLAHVTATRTAEAMRLTAGTPLSDDESSAKRYARLLVSEIRLYNESAVRVGRENRDLLYRLRPEIERARRLYEERVPAGAGQRHAYFHQELVQTLADGDPALLGEPA